MTVLYVTQPEAVESKNYEAFTVALKLLPSLSKLRIPFSGLKLEAAVVALNLPILAFKITNPAFGTET